MQVGDPVFVLIDLGNETNLGGNVKAGTVGNLMVMDHEESYYEIAFDEDRLYIVARDDFRLATPKQVEAGWVDLENVPALDNLATDYDRGDNSF